MTSELWLLHGIVFVAQAISLARLIWSNYHMHSELKKLDKLNAKMDALYEARDKNRQEITR